MRYGWANCFVVWFSLVVIDSPYVGRGIDYGEDESQLYEYATEDDYQIKVYGPEPSKEEKEQDRKVKEIINQYYSPPMIYPPYL